MLTRGGSPYQTFTDLVCPNCFEVTYRSISSRSKQPGVSRSVFTLRANNVKAGSIADHKKRMAPGRRTTSCAGAFRVALLLFRLARFTNGAGMLHLFLWRRVTAR